MKIHHGVNSQMHPFSTCGACGWHRTLNRKEVTCKNCRRVLDARHAKAALEPAAVVNRELTTGEPTNCTLCGGAIEHQPPSDVPGPPDPPLSRHVDDKTPATFKGQRLGLLHRCRREPKT